MAFTKVVGAGIHTLSNITSHNINSSGIITATKFVGPMENGSGISTFYDLRVTNNLTVDGSTTTLDTDLIGVDRVEVAANSNSIVGVAITQSGSADIVNLFDGATKVVTVDDQGKIGLGTYVPEKLLHLETNSSTSGEEILRLENPHTDGKLTKIGFRTHGLNQPQTQILGGNDNSGEGGQIGSSGAGKFKVTVANPSGTHQEVIYAENDAGSKFTRLSSGGTEAIRILSTGNVGIGTDDPAKKLEVFDATQGVIRIRGGGGGSDTSRKADLSLFASGAREYVVRADASDAAFKIVDVSGSNAERFVITSGGDVGISTDPARRLSIFDTDACVLELNSTNSGGTSLRIQNNHTDKMFLGLAGDFIIGQGSNVTDSAIRASGALLFAAGGGNEKVRITSGGSVLIDTTVTTEASADGNDIIIGSTSDTQKGISIVGSTSGGVGNIFFTDGASYKNQGLVQYRHVDDSMRFHTAQYERLRIDSTGDVKFWGTTTADDTNKSVNLTAPSYDTDEEDVNLVQVENESGFNQISFGGGTSGLNAATTLRFLTASAVNTTTGSERLRITSAGKVGIGTDDPQLNLHVHEKSSNASFAHFTNTTTGYDSNQGLSIGLDSDENAVMYHYGSNNIRFATANTQHMVLRSTGQLGIGTAFTPPADAKKLTVICDSVGDGIHIGNKENLYPAGSTGYSDIRFSFYDYLTGGYTAGGEAIIRGRSHNAYTNSRTTQLIFMTSTDDGDPSSGNATEKVRITHDGDVAVTTRASTNTEGVSKVNVEIPARTTTFAADDGDTWHDILIENPGAATNNAVGLAFQVTGDTYHKNAGTGIAAVKNGTNSDYGADLVFITRPQSAVAEERLRIHSDGKVKIGGGDASLALLHVAPADYSLNLQNNSNNKSMILFAKNGTPNDSRSWIEGNGELNGYVAIGAGDAERLRITNKGTAIAYHGAAPTDALTYPSSFRGREGVIGPIFYWPRVYGAHDKGGGYTNLIEGGRLSLRMYGAQGGTQSMFQGGFGVTYGGGGEAIEYNRVRVIFRVTRDGTTEGYEQDSITFKMQSYYYSGGWTDISGSSWNFTGMDSERGYRWTASNWISSGDFAGGFDVPSIAIVYDTDNGNASNHNVRIAAIYLQYARFSS